MTNPQTAQAQLEENYERAQEVREDAAANLETATSDYHSALVSLTGAIKGFEHRTMTPADMTDQALVHLCNVAAESDFENKVQVLASATEIEAQARADERAAQKALRAVEVAA
jgi:hypothetical protein